MVESGFTAVLVEFLASLPYVTDHPWWETIRERVGEKFYRKNAGGAKPILSKKVAEEEAVYSDAGEMVQMKLFDRKTSDFCLTTSGILTQCFLFPPSSVALSGDG